MEELTYSKFVDACKLIARDMKFMNIKSLYGIPRGGLIPAVYISHLTGLPIVDKPKDATTLLIDDIADSGKTLKKYKEYANAKTATIYYHKQSIVKPDIWIYEKKDDWILFPWETKESSKMR